MSVESSRRGRTTLFKAEFGNGRLAPIARRGALLSTLGIVAFFVAAFFVRVWVSRQVVSPWIAGDEFAYARAARDAASGGLSGLLTNFPTTYPGIYPRLIAPAWALFDNAGTPYALAKTINAGLMTLGAVLVYVWGRRFLDRGFALLAGALTLLLPPLLYSGELMTENAFFPAFTLSLLAIGYALERPTVFRQLLVFAPILLTWFVRVQAIALLGILPLAVLLKILLDAQSESEGWREALRRAKAYISWGAVYLIVGLGYVLYSKIEGRQLNSVLGGYYAVTNGVYRPRAALEWITYHYGELMLLVAVIPASAFIVMVGLSLRRRAETTGAERAFLAVAVPAVLVVPAQVGLYSSHFALRVEERNMFHVAPPILLAFALWLQRGLPRPARLGAAAAVVPIALLLTLPLEQLLTVSIYSDTFSFIPFYDVATSPPGGVATAELLLALGALGAGLAFAVLPADLGRMLIPVLVGTALLVLTGSALRGITDYAKGFRAAAGAGDNVSWIDRAVGSDADVGAVFAGGADPMAARSVMLQTWFWNRSLNAVFKTIPIDLLSLPQHTANVLGDRRIAPDPPRDPPKYVISDINTPIAGEEVARTTQHVLYRVAPPLRISGRNKGVHADGWMGESATHTQFWTPMGKAGRIRVLVSRDAWTAPTPPGKVAISVQSSGASRQADPYSGATGTVSSGHHRNFILRAPTPPYKVFVRIDPTFQPSQYGKSDPRQLGAQVAFTPLPARG